MKNKYLGNYRGRLVKVKLYGNITDAILLINDFAQRKSLLLLPKIEIDDSYCLSLADRVYYEEYEFIIGGRDWFYNFEDKKDLRAFAKIFNDILGGK